MTAETLRSLLDLARTSDVVDASMFARVVLRSDYRFAVLAGMQSTPAISTCQDFLRDAVAVLEGAMTINSDEALVLQWFREQPLEDFGMKRPVEIVAAGHADALLKYLASLDSGSTG